MNYITGYISFFFHAPYFPACPKVRESTTQRRRDYRINTIV